MRILVLTYYYRPDLSAGSFRSTALVDALRRKMSPGSHIEVITSAPNRYQSFNADAPVTEELPGVSIRRLAVAPHRSGMLDQSKSFGAFARNALTITGSRHYDIVFATSSRLMTAVLGARIASQTGAKLYLDIRDIFADTIKDVLGGSTGRIAGGLASKLEAYAIRRASRVNVVSEGFLEYFRSRYPGQAFSCFPNAIDEEFLAASPTQGSPSPRSAGPNTLTIVYAGNVGEGQGLHLFLPPLAKELGSRARFVIVGDGGRMSALQQALSDAKVSNVEIRDPVGRSQLIETYRAADVLLLHLNDFPAFRKVLPSKIFEYAAMGKPLWAGVAGFSAEFIAKHVTNAAIFSPCDVTDALKALDRLTLEDAPRSEFLASYSRAAITSRMADEVLDVAQ